MNEVIVDIRYSSCNGKGYSGIQPRNLYPTKTPHPCGLMILPCLLSETGRTRTLILPDILILSE
ncbi:hypothetical protein [Methanocalculus sp.]|uniref:hypothetical protein n=1 Tax=Methanocalculus sp. TaxID=2004547 RepID=UPI002623DEC3|nr:hypothetical protein [Methanocalculus sp.]MDG6250309.1 hypothetical protein [Methanocalculus sp.]